MLKPNPARRCQACRGTHRRIDALEVKLVRLAEALRLEREVNRRLRRQLQANPKGETHALAAQAS